MIRLQTYAGFSFLAMLTMIYHAFDSRGQFYPAMVYLSTSKICFVLLLNMGLVLMCMLWQLVKLLFLGTLREAEIERLNEQLWREIMEILFAITIFRQEFSVTTLAMVTTLLMIKSLHWLAFKRVDYIETAPAVSLLSHIRIVSFMLFLLVVDCVFLYRPLMSFMLTRKASVALFFLFEYMILASTTTSTLVKYAFYVSDLIMDGQWEKKAVYTFYLELIRDLFNLSLYIIFFLLIFVKYGLPLHLIRELYETFRSFRIRIADYIRYRKVTSNVDERFPSATPEELNTNDATCIICREEMVAAKKLHCGHLFHVHCLRSWLERQNNCPTCRALVIPPDSGSAASVPQARKSEFPPIIDSVSEKVHTIRCGPTVANTNTRRSENEKLSPHQARLKAAVLAASIYEKSFVYPPTRFLGSPEQPFANQVKVDNSVNGLSSSGLKVSTLKERVNFIGSQIEMLEIELQNLKKQKEELLNENDAISSGIISSDLKGKAVVQDAST